MFKYPRSKPKVKPEMRADGLPEGWCCTESQQMLKELIDIHKPKVVAEIGSFKGMSACVITKHAPNVTLYCIDHWEGSPEHEKMGIDCSKLYETFIVNCWEQRKQIVPIKLSSIEGLQALIDMNVTPEIIYIDGAHDATNVYQDTRECKRLFPKAILCGDDWTLQGVRDGVNRFCKEFYYRPELYNDRVWTLKRNREFNYLVESAEKELDGLDLKGAGGFTKYAEAESQILEKLRVLKALGLDKSSKFKSCFDISTCFGWTPWLLKQNGWEVFYTDNLDEPCDIAMRARKMFGLHDCVDFKYQRNKDNVFKFVPLPYERKFDVIMAVAVGPHSYFDCGLWADFLDDALDKLNDGGFLYIAPNTSPGMEELKGVLTDYKHSEPIAKGWKVTK